MQDQVLFNGSGEATVPSTGIDNRMDTKHYKRTIDSTCNLYKQLQLISSMRGYNIYFKIYYPWVHVSSCIPGSS